MENRILLIQAYQGRVDRFGSCFPIGLCYIATALDDGDNVVTVFDPNTSPNPYQDMEREVKVFHPDIVGLSIRNIDTCDKRDIFYFFKTVEPTIQLIKNSAPDAKIMVGGSGFSMFAKKIMERINQIDFGVYLEGEETVVDLIANISQPESVKGIYYRQNGLVLFTGPRTLPDFSCLPTPKRHYVDVNKYPQPINNMGIQTKRGCPMKCAYCSYPFLNGKKVRMRSPEDVVDEIEYLINQYGVNQFNFVDGVFNTPKGHAEAICHEIINRNLEIQWQGWFDIATFTEDFFLLAKKAGLRRAPFSPDAASNSSLKALKKGYTTKDIERVIEITRHQKEVDIAFGFFATPPEQTFIGLLNTIYLYIKINLIFALKGTGGASISWIRVEPDTKMYDIAISKGVITEQTELLPEEEEGLLQTYFSEPKVWYGDLAIQAVNFTANKLLKPLVKFAKSIKKGASS